MTPSTQIKLQEKSLKTPSQMPGTFLNLKNSPSHFGFKVFQTVFVLPFFAPPQ